MLKILLFCIIYLISARSPVFSHLNASFQGLSTIRAFGVQKILENEFNEHQDRHSSVWFMNLGTSRAFGLWLDAVCMAFLIIVVLILVVAGRGIDTLYINSFIKETFIV